MRARPTEIMASRGLEVVSDTGALTAAVDEAIAANPGIADKIRSGKVAAAGALVGAVMKTTRGQADAEDRPRADPGAPRRRRLTGTSPSAASGGAIHTPREGVNGDAWMEPP